MRLNAEKICECYNIITRKTLFAWQKREIKKWCENTHEKPFMLVAPRRNGKSEIIKSISYYLLAKGKKILYTVQDGALASEIYFDFVNELEELIETRSQNSYTLSLQTGGRIKILVRADRGAGTGWDFLVVDEVQEYSKNHLAKLEPTVATTELAKTGHNIFYAGTAPMKSSTGNVVNDRLLDKDNKDQTIYGVKNFVEKPNKTHWGKKSVNPSYGLILHDAYFKSILDGGNIDNFNNEQLGFNQQRPDAPNYTFRKDEINAISAPLKDFETNNLVVEARAIGVRLDLQSGMIGAVEAVKFAGEDKISLFALGAKSESDGLSWLAEICYQIDPDIILVEMREDFKRFVVAMNSAGARIKAVEQASKAMYVANYAKVVGAVKQQNILLRTQKTIENFKELVDVGMQADRTRVKVFTGKSAVNAVIGYASGLAIFGIQRIIE